MAREIDDLHNNMYVTIRACEALSAIQLRKDEIVEGGIEVYKDITNLFINEIRGQTEELVVTEFQVFFG